MRKVMLCFGLCAALLLCCACESEEEGIFDGFKSLDLPVDEETVEEMSRGIAKAQYAHVTAADRLATVKEYRSKHTKLTELCNDVLSDGVVTLDEYIDVLDLAKELGF